MAKDPRVETSDYSAGSMPPLNGNVAMYEAGPPIAVYSWSPDPPGTPCARSTQVHLHFHVAGGVIVLRFKGAAGLDAVIDALQMHRKDVWGSR